MDSSQNPMVAFTKYRYHRKNMGRVTITHYYRVTITHYYQKRGARFHFKQTILIHHNKSRTNLFFSRNME